MSDFMNTPEYRPVSETKLSRNAGDECWEKLVGAEAWRLIKERNAARAEAEKLKAERDEARQAVEAITRDWRRAFDDLRTLKAASESSAPLKPCQSKQGVLRGLVEIAGIAGMNPREVRDDAWQRVAKIAFIAGQLIAELKAGD